MTNALRVSVVMSVYNGAEILRDSIQSVLSQEIVEFEFIVVNDGSTDASGTLLDGIAAQDARMRVVHQENRGLTRALIRGCSLARGKFIARQDCGDLSLQGRLRDELHAMELDPEAALVSCGTSFVGPQGEPLDDVVISEDDALAGLTTLDPQRLRGPSHHGSTLFRRDLYERVGGYREQFYFAQDLDLWTRMAEHGRHVAISQILYQARITLESISSQQRQRQIESSKIILECARLRRSGLSESASLERARAIQPHGARQSNANRARALYFIGQCLRKREDPRAANYFRQALQANPFHLKSAVRLLTG